MKKYILKPQEPDDLTKRLSQEFISHDGNYKIPESYLTRPVKLEPLIIEEVDE